ncbi:MAG: hypothetical protein A2X94_14855 [Bdellovibrionales bacterium GWB1_55_8]|nr:MAG: hypothetical protein A2X94_14855 [Bdellovibrionales bacterium GWB1_55_8]
MFHAMDLNLVEFWLRRDPERWLIGALAGFIAAAISMGVAMIAAGFTIGEIWFPLKLAAVPVLGGGATRFGFAVLPILIGLVSIVALSGLLGFLFAHFVWSNSLRVLLPMGLTWGIFCWVFIWNLFLQSVRAIFTLQVSSGVAFGVCLVFGLSLTVVAALDRRSP